MRGRSLKISFSRCWFSIRCYFHICILFRLGKAGWYCVAKGRSFLLSDLFLCCRAVFMSANFTSERYFLKWRVRLSNLTSLYAFVSKNVISVSDISDISLGVRPWGITNLPIERARCLPQMNAIKLLGNPTGKSFERQAKAALEVKTRLL